MQMIEVVHPGLANIPKKELREKIAKMRKIKNSETVVLYGMHNKFGGQRSTGFCLIYDSPELRQKYDTKCRNNRELKYVKDKPKPSRLTRKAKKEVKMRRKKVHGIAKTKVQVGDKKKKK